MTFSLGVASAAARTPKHRADLIVTNASVDTGTSSFEFSITRNPLGKTTTSAKFFDALTYDSRTGAPASSTTDRTMQGERHSRKGTVWLGHSPLDLRRGRSVAR
jgi:hypothetical protein